MPLYDEATALGPAVTDLAHFFENILCIDDGSTVTMRRTAS